MKILAIDTSCDDTCISILNIKNQKLKIRGPIFEVLSNIISSQVKVHQKYGGVYPSLAKREHQKNLPIVLKKALRQVGLITTESRVGNIAVTVGPGLDPCLWTGINFAKDLARQWNLPIIPINHIESHIFANWLITLPGSVIQFPAICLVVSGGHTQLILMTPVRKASLSNGAGKNWKYKIVGETRDDAAGECFDKTARILGLPYPGGPAIAAEAAKLSTTHYKLQTKLPRPMINSKDYDFSFSGLKTAVLYNFRSRAKKTKKSKEYIGAMAREIQQAVIDVLIKKTIKAAKNYRAKSILLGGGVASNNELRKQFNYKLKTINYTSRDISRSRSKYKLKFLVPPKNLCTDNAAMVGVAGYFNRKKAIKNWQKIKAVANLRI